MLCELPGVVRLQGGGVQPLLQDHPKQELLLWNGCRKPGVVAAVGCAAVGCATGDAVHLVKLSLISFPFICTDR